MGPIAGAPGIRPHGLGPLGARPVGIGSHSHIPARVRLLGVSRALLQAHLPAPGAPALAGRVRELLAGQQPVADLPTRGLDHGAFIPLMCMWPDAEVPVLQISMPSLNAETLLETGRKLAPLRDEGVLIIGSGFLTHGLAFIDPTRSDDDPPAWSAEFDAWAADCIARRDFDALLDYRHEAPALEFAHPTVDHLVPLFVALGAVIDDPASIDTTIEGFWLNLSKRSFQFN